MKTYQRGGEYFVCGEGKKKKRMCEEKISSYVWKGVIHEKDVCKK